MTLKALANPFFRRTSHRRQPRSTPPSSALRLESLEARDLLTGTWTPLAHLAPSTTGTMLLLSDGTVMVQGGGVSNAWYRLTPDATGSYAHGTWSLRTPMGLQRQYFASNVLPDGQVFVLGGEYSGPQGQATWTHSAEIYDPATDSWRSAAVFPQPRFGDDPSELLPDGRVLAGYLSGPQTYIYDPASNTWTATGDKLDNDRSDEETWVKLPDDSILSYDIFTDGHAQRYVPAQHQWVATGAVPVSLSGPGVQNELGPAFLLPDGRTVFIGATNHTALYNPATNTWSAGPDLPAGMGADDAPGAELSDGHILFAADQVPESAPTSLFEFNPTTNTLSQMTVPGAMGLDGKDAYDNRMLVLPTGEVLFSNGSSQLYVYTPNDGPAASWRPVIDQVSAAAGGSYRLTGRQLNGLSEGASYGDDAEMSSNYPLIRLTDASGRVKYATTYNWSSTGVATGSTEVSVSFRLPAGLAAGHYSLTVVANGIASAPVRFQVGGNAQTDLVVPPIIAHTLGEQEGQRAAPPPAPGAGFPGLPVRVARPAPAANREASAADTSAPSAALRSASGETNPSFFGVRDALFVDAVLEGGLFSRSRFGEWS